MGRSPTAVLEARTWKKFYRNIDDPVVAQEVVQLLDSEPVLRAELPGLYVRAKETGSRSAARRAKYAELGRRVGSLTRTLRAPRPTAEKRVWSGMYRRAENLISAQEVVEYLDGHPDRKAELSGLYVRARQW